MKSIHYSQFNKRRGILLLILFVFTCNMVLSQNKGLVDGAQYQKLLVFNITLIDGNGTPAVGPVDIVIEKDKIKSISRSRGDIEKYADYEHIIDGSGHYLLPGLINIHGHVHNRNGCPPEYIYKLWLSCGITTVRDVGSDSKLTLNHRELSRLGEIEAPSLYLYISAGGTTENQIRRRVRNIQKMGGDGVKIFGLDRNLMAAAMDEAAKLNLKVAHHVGVEETDAWDDIRFGTHTIEHWYGIPDAALKGSQNFPPGYNYSNESDRFRWAGHLWREADPEKLDKVLQTMVDSSVNWCPTLVIYEANRDLVRAANQPWFENYLHPVVESYFVPNPSNHGSYQWNWSTSDEIFWKENYRLWMKALRQFADKGGIIGIGEDAGYIYQLYGFALIRELELHQEAGFHPIDVVKHATLNNAKILGIDDITGRIKENYEADMIILDSNPLENFKFLYPTGVDDFKNGKMLHRGGIKWTIKDGRTYNAKRLIKEVAQLVENARIVKKSDTPL